MKNRSYVSTLSSVSVQRASPQVILLLPILAVCVGTNAHADSATWKLNPVSDDWNTAANWTPPTVPNGPSDTATFDASNPTSVSISAGTEVSAVTFTADASAFTVTSNPGQTFTISGTGITNSSGVVQNFVTDVDDLEQHGVISFNGSAVAGNSTFFTNKGSICCGSATDQGGQVEFNGMSSAGHGTFVCTAAGPGGFLGGQTKFFNQSTAGEGLFIAEGGELNGGMTQFFDSSSADHGTFITNGGRIDGGSTFLKGGATAANGIFTVNGGENSFDHGGEMEFSGHATADHGLFTINGAAASGASGGFLSFSDFSTAAYGSFIVNGGTVTDAEGGEIDLFTTAGNATFIINGGVGGGGDCALASGGDSNTATFKVFGNGSLTLAVNTRAPVTVGSIEGDGNVITGLAPLNIGSNNLNTNFSGVIQSFGAIAKVGTGTLTLSGANTYTGGTTVTSGTLKINNRSGSGTGTGAVGVSGGTLSGGGTVSGAVTIGTGSGTGAILDPGKGTSRPVALTMQSQLTFQTDGTYTYRLNTRRVQADQVVANGVTINGGAPFNFTAVANKRLTAGTVFTAISNTAASPISGTFANLPDGSTFTVGRNTFQVSYSDGDGNDLTLTSCRRQFQIADYQK